MEEIKELGYRDLKVRPKDLLRARLIALERFIAVVNQKRTVASINGSTAAESQATIVLNDAVKLRDEYVRALVDIVEKRAPTSFGKVSE